MIFFNITWQKARSKFCLLELDLSLPESANWSWRNLGVFLVFFVGYSYVVVQWVDSSWICEKKCQEGWKTGLFFSRFCLRLIWTCRLEWTETFCSSVFFIDQTLTALGLTWKTLAFCVEELNGSSYFMMYYCMENHHSSASEGVAENISMQFSISLILVLTA